MPRLHSLLLKATSLMLALATGATTAVFSVVNAAWLRPLPHLDADRCAFLYVRPENEGLTHLSATPERGPVSSW